MAGGGSDDDDSNMSLLSNLKKTKRELFQEHGLETWALRHTVCLVVAGVIAALCLGFSGYRFARIAQNEAEEQKALKQPSVSHIKPTQELKWDTRFKILGCYPLQNGDGVFAPSLRDLTCMPKGAMGIPCRSGLPFYRLAIMTSGGQRAPISWRMCAAYCLFKGFDVSGVVLSTECRCGATAENIGIWHHKKTPLRRVDLLWQPPWNQVPSDSPNCSIVAVRYTGKLPITGLSFDRTNEDVTYVRSIVRGKKVGGRPKDVVHGPSDKASPRQRIAMPGATNPAPTTAPGLQAVAGLQQEWLESASVASPGHTTKLFPASTDLGASTQPEVRERLKPCYPEGQCASGLPWPIRTDFQRTGIPFAFSDSVGEDTKQVFMDVIKELHAMTCIRFNEVSPFYNRTYKIRLRGDLNGCFTNYVGYPAGGMRKDTELNLGWCKTELEKGNIIHEIGHALGMSHEHTRPDRDAYVLIKWDTLTTAEDRAQYEVSQDAYVGSREAGAVPYDFESIMHYPLTRNMMTKPVVGGRGAHDSQIGQRQQLSTGDIFQLRNMYNCDTPTMPCIDNDEGLNRHGPYEGPNGEPVTCAAVAAGGLCTGQYAQDIRYFCAKSCDVCPAELPQPEVEGCNDAQDLENVCRMYSDFCPGKVPGYEQWMTNMCRKTCFIESYCGTSTTIRMLTTTTEPTLPPDQRVLRLAIDFDIVGGGYDLESKKQRIELSNNLKERAMDEFGTYAKVRIDPFSPAKGRSVVELACGCDPAFGLDCSISCRDLSHSLMRFTADGTKFMNKVLMQRGLSGVVVTNTFMGTAGQRIRAVIFNEWTLHSTCIVGGIAAAVACALLVYRCWLNSEHDKVSRSHSGGESYSEMSEMDPER